VHEDAKVARRTALVTARSFSPPHPTGGVAMRVQELMTKEVQTCQPHHTLAEPARLMWECDCGVVPVVDDARRVVGMVTDRDICMATYTQGKPPSAIPVQSVMAKNVVSCRVDEDLASAEQKMQKAQVRRLPVVDQDGV